MKFALILILLSGSAFATEVKNCDLFKEKGPDEAPVEIPVSKAIEATKIILASNPNLKPTQVFSALILMKPHVSVRQIMNTFGIDASAAHQVAETRLEDSSARILLAGGPDKDIKPLDYPEIQRSLDLDCLQRLLDSFARKGEMGAPRGEMLMRRPDIFEKEKENEAMRKEQQGYRGQTPPRDNSGAPASR